jgi:hypothetical protein
MSSDCADCIVSEITEDMKSDKDTKDTQDTNDTSTNFVGGVSNTSSFPSTKTELEKLIEILKTGIKKKEPGVKYIKYPTLLVLALEELNSLIGMDRLKDSIAIQTVSLIERMKAGEKTTAMLNCMLSGPPGVGKSRAGVLLAKIWFALGFLNTGSTTTTTTHKKTEIPTPLGGPGGSGGTPDMSALVLLLIAWIGTYVIQMLSYIYSQVGLFWLGLILGMVILIVIFLYWGDNKTTWIKKYVYEEKVTITEEELKNVADRDIISVVSRDAFCAEFMGQTAIKTKRLLEANIGKVLFIDEAYSLINDPRDAYGYECLNTLNLFLSENPDKIVVIFAGYREKMENSIFTAQPGLSRRIMWKFECDPYSGEQLAEIFFLQAKKEGWEIQDEDKIRKLITRNEFAFPGYGGDCERLVYLSSLEATRSSLSTISESFLSGNVTATKQKILKYRDVELGLISLKENKN